MKINKYIILILSLFFAFGCENFDLDNLQDPNDLPFQALDVNLTMNHIQREMGSLVERANRDTEGLTRMKHNFNSNWNGMARGTQAWRKYYSDILPESNLIIEKSQNTIEPLPNNEAIAKIIRSYGAMLLVDLYGKIPYSEAGQFFQNTNPALDNDLTVYESCFNDLTSAKELLTNNSDSFEFDDFYYNGNKSNWIKLINTLLFKYYLNISNTGTDYSSEMNVLINEGLIENSNDDFEWKFVDGAAAESRHPMYIRDYDGTQVTSYMSNYYMWILNNEKVIKGITTNPDPRTRFYFFRQSLSIPTPSDIPSTQQVLPCLVASRPAGFDAVDSDLPFCIADEENVYWGRDNFNVDGIGPENELRTTYGLYPIGGRFDDDRGQSAQNSTNGPRNLDGEGISPIMLSSFAYFMRAEAALLYSTSDNAATMLENGIDQSLTKVKNFGGIPQNNISTEDLDTYISEVMAYYNTAPDKLDVIAKEFLIALWGNGYEAYNLYRRTARPLNLQPGISPSGDEFPRSLFYPQNSVTGNSSINQKDDTSIGPFWYNNTNTLD